MIELETVNAVFKAAATQEDSAVAELAREVTIMQVIDERDAYRESLCKAVCKEMSEEKACAATCGCARSGFLYCDAVTERVDGCTRETGAAMVESVLDKLGGSKKSSRSSSRKSRSAKPASAHPSEISSAAESDPKLIG